MFEKVHISFEIDTLILFFSPIFCTVKVILLVVFFFFFQNERGTDERNRDEMIGGGKSTIESNRQEMTIE